MSSSGNYEILSRQLREDPRLYRSLGKVDPRLGAMVLFRGDVFIVNVRREKTHFAVRLRKMPFMTSWMGEPVLLSARGLRKMLLEGLSDLNLRLQIEGNYKLVSVSNMPVPAGLEPHAYWDSRVGGEG